MPDSDTSILYNDNNSIRGDIFLEINTNNQVGDALYTMHERPRHGLPSAYMIYMLSESEYEAAIKLVGSWTIWERYCKNKYFMQGPARSTNWSGLEKWREEKVIQQEAKARAQLVEQAEGGNVQAIKALFEEHKVSKRGRPSKAEVDKAAKIAAEKDKKVKDDLKRIRLATVDGKESTG